MSVAAQSPFQSSKRLFENTDSPEYTPSCGTSTKRPRRSHGSPSGRGQPRADHQAYVVSASALAALRSLFPDMDEKAVAEVLDQCGNNVDAAINRLKSLRLSTDDRGSHGAVPAAEAAAQPQEDAKDFAGGAGTPPAEVPTLNGLKSAAEWIDTVIQQMQQAKSLEDARIRAASVLQAVEKAVSEKHMKDKESQVGELLKENTVLKRAVAIQNSRLQEVAGKDAELQSLKALIVQYQQKVHNLELSNYSLAMHLRQATGSADFAQAQRRPDVF